MMSKKILIVDDELKMRILIRDFLRREGFETIDVSNGEQAIESFLNNKDIDLIILDVMMPIMNGWETLSEIRTYSDTIPILMLTAKSENDDVIKGFQLGSDDYLTKPFHMPILIERVKALLRRTQQKDEVFIGDLYIDFLGRVVKVNDKIIDLSGKEYELLLFLYDHKNVSITREEIMKKVWNYDFIGDGRTIDTHIKTLRNKLGKCGDYIKTVWGVGYKFDAEEN